MKNKLNRYAIKNLTITIIVGQVLVYLAINAGFINYSTLSLNYGGILNGEIWRVITFLFIPPTTSPIWAVISWYILFLMGSNLEHYWGELHYNIYIFVAVVLTNIVAFIFNLSIGTNYYLQSSIFLAFAFLNPNFQVRLFFIIPVKIKWIAIVNWILYLWILFTGNSAQRLLIIASLTNFTIFFSKDIYYKIKYRGKTVKKRIEKRVSANKPLHTCAVCSRNDLDYPHLDFRYCSQCSPEKCYCEDHILNHDHIGE